MSTGFQGSSAPAPLAPALRLHSLSFDFAPAAHVPLDDFLTTDSALVWLRHSEGMVGFGEAFSVSATGEHRFEVLRTRWRELLDAAAPEAELFAFVAVAFSSASEHESRLVVPEMVIRKVGGEAQLFWIRSEDVPAESETDLYHLALSRLAELQEDSAPGHLGFPDVDPLPAEDRLTVGQVNDEQYKTAITSGIELIESGELTKLVLARDAVAELAQPVQIARVLKELSLRYRDCWTYSMRGLIGATPEMLIQVINGTARARVLAGTLDRKLAPGSDPDYAKRALTDNEKQRHEHQLAIDSLTTQLRPYVTHMDAHAEPFVLELPNVWHLASDVTAIMPAENPPSALDLAEILHPTAAVCGTPTVRAAQEILRLEGMDRGRYAGPVGWIDSHGNGEFGIALRGGIVESEHRIRLFAGCGIVGASDPESELAESWAKMRPMKQALSL